MIAVSKELLWAGPLVALSLIIIQLAIMRYFDRKLSGIVPFVLIFMTAGLIIDSILMHTGILTFSASPWHGIISPPWMMVLWLELGIALFISGHHMFKRYFIMGIMALLGASLFYASLGEFGAVFFYDNLLDTALIGLIWALVFPLCLRLYQISPAN